ncbi:MAG TPA: Lrp/AsnC family transcriptional regulator, partial [Acidimicrobiales bacterium]|nr:Lrp/AsnC family transcriptional regulator [Acidimicrobiales bacterium]
MLMVQATDYDEKILEALGEPRYDFRTSQGIARELSLDETTVRRVLERRKDAVRVSAATDKRGQRLYAPKSRRVSNRERLAT